MDEPRLFPSNFTWGVGTSAYQIEGASFTHGKGDSIWDDFARESGKVQSEESGSIACDHYTRYQEDVSLMHRMGVGAYRFSISWPRVLPEGKGSVNQAGIDFYDRLVDELTGSGIEPWVTLFHWDYPSSLMRLGGWSSSDSSKWFADYVAIVADKLGDRVKHWITLNEPNIVVPYGFERGIHAPGLELGRKEAVRLMHSLLLAHGQASQVLRSRPDARVGATLSFSPWEASPEKAHRKVSKDIARAKSFEISETNPLNSPVVWADAMIRGSYPTAFLERFGAYLPTRWEAEISSLESSVDFSALNIYASTGVIEKDSSDDWIGRKYAQCESTPKTLFHWPVAPSSLYWGPCWMYERYKLPVVITENGMSAHDWVQEDGTVRDYHRIDFTSRYLGELHRVIEDGVPVEGYFHWSLMDNFEWAEGYRQRFGLIHVDRKTLNRTLKQSGHWYADVMLNNALPAVRQCPSEE